MLDLYCVMTENCNLSCDHCYMSAGPRKKHTTVSSENFQKMLRHLPITKTRIALTGGEVFTVEDNLRAYLELIENENKKRENKNRINIQVQTNGFWLKKRNAKDMLQYLREKRVIDLDISSDDSYHEKQGLRLDLELISLARSYIPEVSLRGAGPDVLPLGRAKSVETSRLIYPLSCKNSNRGINSDVTIRNNGAVYPCCFPIFKYQGNVFEEPLLDILNRAKEDPRFVALNKYGLRGIALQDGVESAELERKIAEFGSCSVCADLYGRSCK